MATNAIEISVVGINGIPQPSTRTFIVTSLGTYATDETKDVAGAVCTVVVPKGQTTNMYTNYQVTESLADVLAALNEDTTADLTIVDTLTILGNIVNSLETGISAFATGGQGSATQLAADYNNVTTCATAADSVKLPAAVKGMAITVKNNGATALAVFPATGDAIDAGAANASVTLPVNCTKKFFAIDGTTWETTDEVISTTSIFTDLVTAKTASGIVSVASPIAFSGTPQTLTGAGAVNLTTYSTLLVTTGANALTLAAGSEGQFKFIRMKTDGGDGTLTVTNLQGGTTLTFNDAGDFVHLLYQDAKWNILTNSGATLA